MEASENIKSKKEQTIIKRQDRLKKLVLEHIQKTPLIESVSQRTGVSRSTIYRWLDDSIEFKREFNKNKDLGVERINELAQSKLMSKINDGDLMAIKYWLSNRSREFMTKLQHLFVDTKVNDVPLTPEEETKIANALIRWKGLNKNNT